MEGFVSESERTVRRSEQGRTKEVKTASFYILGVLCELGTARKGGDDAFFCMTLYSITQQHGGTRQSTGWVRLTTREFVSSTFNFIYVVISHPPTPGLNPI